MRWKKFLSVLPVALMALLCLSSPVCAQEYSFALDREIVDVWINGDGSVTLEYWFTFTCGYAGHDIDVVDVGLPTGDYDLDDIHADVGGREAWYVEESEYVTHGVAVWLGDGTIYAGETGTVHVLVDRVGGMVYEDSEDRAYASTQFSPTWFGSDFVYGATDMTVRFHLPVGVQPDEPRWHASPRGWPQERPVAALDADGRVLYVWHDPAAEPDVQYTFGASFPRGYVAEGAVQRAPSVWEKFATGAFNALVSVISSPVAIIVGGISALVGLSMWSQRRRKMRYLPPTMKVEGVGIKRGLTAVEAAIILETPLNKVLTMILFGLLKKGTVTVLDDDPLRVEVNRPLPKKLRSYERKFLEAVEEDGGLDETQLRSAVTGLVKAVNKKMKGFSRKETMAYYRDIVRRAWQQIKEAETPQVRSRRFDEGLEWAMLDRDFEDRTEQVFRGGPVYLPMWWGYYRPWGSAVSAGRGRAAVSPSSGSRAGLPTLPGAVFAASIVRGIEGTAGRIVRSVVDFTAGVTQVTNPPPVSSGGRSYSGGGSSCACACACACAGCACACAGGGR